LNEVQTRYETKYNQLPASPDKDNSLESEVLKMDHIKFVSALDSKPIQPAYLRLMSLK